jgi:hypothetical protein
MMAAGAMHPPTATLSSQPERQATREWLLGRGIHLINRSGEVYRIVTAKSPVRYRTVPERAGTHRRHAHSS